MSEVPVKSTVPDRTNSAAAQRVTGAEIRLESRNLRLRGRVDRIRRVGADAFEVRDYKSGSVLSEDGTVKDEIALQLRAYGLMILERYPRAFVRLIVDDGTDRNVEFDEEAQDITRARLQAIAQELPDPGRAPIATMATPGAGCWGCHVRHVCPAYREMAPKWWAAYPRDVSRISSDTWGIITALHTDEHIGLVITDDAGRRVRVDGVDARHGISPAVLGRRIWLFELESSGPTRGFGGERFHPRAFHELPSDRRERKAWNAQIFIEAQSIQSSPG
jgi:PD-(D/E)XK nuclease superfamily